VPSSAVDWITGGGAIGVVVFVIYAILRGHLVPRATVEDIRKDRDVQIAKLGEVVDLWRTAALAKDEAIREFLPMLTEIIENDRLILRLLGAIHEVVDKSTEGTS
jgi:hypothetical protein